MTEKQYKTCRLVIVISLSVLVSTAISLKQYYLPIVFTLTAFAGMYYCRKRLKTSNVLADERDYAVAGNAARYSIAVYSWAGVIGTFVLMAISQGEGTLFYVAQYIAYSVCFLMLTNASLFNYLHKKDEVV